MLLDALPKNSGCFTYICYQRLSVISHGSGESGARCRLFKLHTYRFLFISPFLLQELTAVTISSMHTYRASSETLP